RVWRHDRPAVLSHRPRRAEKLPYANGVPRQMTASSRTLMQCSAGRIAAALMYLGTGHLAAAETSSAVADFYRGKTISLVVGSGEGGGFDLSARVSAPFLSRYTPGHPTVVVQNMPGASGLRAGEYVYNVAPHD